MTISRRTFLGAVPATAAAGLVAGTGGDAVAAALRAAAGGGDDGYDGADLWLRYVRVGDPGLLRRYRDSITTIIVENADRNKVHRHTPNLAMAPGSAERLVETTLEAARDELVRGLGGLLGRAVPVRAAGTGGPIPRGAVVVGTPDGSPAVRR
ncbi:MAG TPA: hypothetical protein VE465_22750, partial [Streptosporangiaceae bacterium]|nr:hypothetical protein [Streptosporangiaceae bacterium]